MFSLEELILGFLPIVFLFLFPLFIDFFIEKKSIDIFAPHYIFLLFLFLQFFVWPLWVYIEQRTDSWGMEITFFTERKKYFLEAQFLAALSMFLFLVGFYITKNKRPKIKIFDNFRIKKTDGFSLLLLNFSGFIVALISFLLYMKHMGGIGYYLSHIDEARSLKLGGTGVFLYGIFIFQITSLTFVYFYYRYKRYVILSHIFYFFSLLITFLLGMRNNLMFVIFGYFIIRHFTYKPIKFNIKLIIFSTFFIGLNIIISIFRSYGTIIESGITEKIPLSEKLYFFFGRFHGTETLVRVLDYMDNYNINFTFFSNYLRDLIITWIPSFIYTDKPKNIILEFRDTFFPELAWGTGAPEAGSVPEMYWHLGITGVSMYFITIGVFAGIIYRIAKEKKYDFYILLYSIIYIFFFLSNETQFLYFFQSTFRAFVLILIFMYLSFLRNIRYG